LKISKTPDDKIISKFLVLINLISLKKGYGTEEDEFIKYLEENRGYELDYDFDDIKNAVHGLRCEDKILDLINKMEESKG